MGRLIDLVGKKFGRLLVLERIENDKFGNPRWKCLCDCGRIATPLGGAIRSGHSRSCGCVWDELASNVLHQRGPKHPAWRGGRSISHGYISIPVDGRHVKEHRYLMEQKLGRKLLPTENVHHKNGDRADNRVENLEIWNTSQPCGQRIEDKVAHAKEILALYEPKVLAEGQKPSYNDCADEQNSPK